MCEERVECSEEGMRNPRQRDRSLSVLLNHIDRSGGHDLKQNRFSGKARSY